MLVALHVQLQYSMLLLFFGCMKNYFQIPHPDKRKIHFLFTDGKEMTEEYDLKTDELIGKQQVLSLLVFWILGLHIYVSY